MQSRRNSAANWSSFSWLRATRTRLLLSAANSFANSRPIPDDAPVIRRFLTT